MEFTHVTLLYFHDVPLQDKFINILYSSLVEEEPEEGGDESESSEDPQGSNTGVADPTTSPPRYPQFIIY